ncbi:MAG: pilus assembly protein CpaB [Oscillochloris sp.]|nr:pilus assembly protein CpaB [Oscillochloris sp.]
MRRGGVLILLIGLILIVGAVAALLLFQPELIGGGGGSAVATPSLPTEVPQVDLVRARVDIPANTVIEDGLTLLEVVSVPVTEFNQDTNFSSISEVEGQLTIRDLRAGAAIEAAALTDPGLSQQLPTAEPDRNRDKAYPFVVNNLSGVADQIKPGDFVDIVATFNMSRRQVFPTGVQFEEVNGQQIPQIVTEITDPTFTATKTIVQRAQVLRILRPQVAVSEDGEESEPEAPPPSSSLPQVDESGQPITAGSEGAGTPSSLTTGIWTLILAVNNQEVELMEFALATDSRLVLVLRGAGDTDFESTIGSTYDLLVSEFGVPLPRALPPRVVSEDEAFTPDPTQTPAPTRVP